LDARTPSSFTTSLSLRSRICSTSSPADKICAIEAVYLSNVGGAADAGDAQEELLRVEMIRLPATVTVGSGGTSMTPNPLSGQRHGGRVHGARERHDGRDDFGHRPERAFGRLERADPVRVHAAAGASGAGRERAGGRVPAGVDAGGFGDV
jgi:hypothetical protein